MLKQLTLITGAFLISFVSVAQLGEYRSASNPYYWKNRKPFEGYWQQDVHYSIKVTLYDSLEIVGGKEELVYYNNSPDTLIFSFVSKCIFKGWLFGTVEFGKQFSSKIW